MATATWRFAITTKPTASTAAVVVDFLEKPLEVAYTRRRSSYNELMLTVENRDDIHALSGAAYRRCLLGVRNGVARFHGQITEHEEDGRGFTVTAKDPYYNMSWRRVAEALTYSSVGDGEIAMRLIEEQNDYWPSFLTRGTIQSGANRTRTFEMGSKVSERIEYLTKLVGAFEFTIDATFGTIGELAKFNAHSPYDELRPKARFEYGSDTLANLDDYRRTVRPLINKANIVGKNPLHIASAQSVSGREAYGLWEDERGQVNVDASTAAGVTTLQEIANYHVQDAPKYQLTLMPGPDAPQLFTDFDVIHKVPIILRNFGRTIRAERSVLACAIRLDPASGTELIEELTIEDPDEV